MTTDENQESPTAAVNNTDSTMIPDVASTGVETVKTTLGRHTVYTGDCISVMNSGLVPEVDLIIADPPYWKVVG